MPDHAALYEKLRADPSAARFQQGQGRVVTLGELLDTLVSDQPVALVEPVPAELNWNPSIARLWACDVAEISIYPFEDDRALDALAAARRFARGEATREELATANAEAEEAQEDTEGKHQERALDVALMASSFYRYEKEDWATLIHGLAVEARIAITDDMDQVDREGERVSNLLLAHLFGI